MHGWRKIRSASIDLFFLPDPQLWIGYFYRPKRTSFFDINDPQIAISAAIKSTITKP